VEPNKQHIPEHQGLAAPVESAKVTRVSSSKPKVDSNLRINSKISKSSKPSKPQGEVMIPALVCGSVGIVLATILSLINRFKSPDQLLKEKYMAEPFLMPDVPMLHGGWNLILVLIVCFGISFAVLDSDKIWRRVMLFFLALVIVVMGSPVLMMWDVFWSPCMLVVGLLWSWFCAFIYSLQHTMPCELLVPTKKIKRAKQSKSRKPTKAKKTKKQPKLLSNSNSTDKTKSTEKEKPVFVAPITKIKSKNKAEVQVEEKNEVKTVVTEDSVDSIPFAETEAITPPLQVTTKFQPKE